MKCILVSLLLFYSFSVFGQHEAAYSRYLDSADIALNKDALKALAFLDSIPAPIEKYIDGEVGKYYLLKGYAYDRTDHGAKVFQNLLLAVRHGEEEKDYETAGGASIALFKEVYFVKKDSSAFLHLKAAEKFYSLANDKIGSIEVKQMPAYVAFSEDKFELSNTLILQNLDEYRETKEDAYYYLFANFMLATNYTHLNDLKNANIYLKQFRSLKLDSTIADFNYKSFEVNLNICLAKLHLDKKQMDSSLYYLSSANKLRDAMSTSTKGEYYTFASEIYKAIDKDSMSATYLDSLKGLHKKLYADNQDAGVALNEVLKDSEKTLLQEKATSKVVKTWLLIIAAISVVLFLLFIFGYKKLKSNKDEFSRRDKDFSKLKSNNEKLKVRTKELEIYITEVKEKIKLITAINDEEEQQHNIRSLYRSINSDANNYKNSGENHVYILKELNESFFNEIKRDYPNLTDTEFLVCYYLKLGFKNKEIAFFLNRSIRAIESQRYRISNKMNLESSKELADNLSIKYAN